ncbi:hypothetical protein QMO56_24970 [Roseomonas sp. E05]|uniref:hypothetical protein n=1 Tax=Roseomonas sp. E05 TaxID=3046310 RepID=UPI0024BBEAE8|nr:hypothetical protein [Roseomonas sp. E05]MDJ0391364.1 hypothetical protein [Roseomonas sp. E05]
MADANRTTPSRFAATPAAVLSSRAARTASKAPDARLAGACRRYLALEAEFNRLFELECAAQEAGDKARADRFASRQCALVPEQQRVLAEVMERPARTAEGMRLKAEVALMRVQTGGDGGPLSVEDQLLASLARDLQTAAGGVA